MKQVNYKCASATLLIAVLCARNIQMSESYAHENSININSQIDVTKSVSIRIHNLFPRSVHFNNQPLSVMDYKVKEILSRRKRDTFDEIDELEEDLSDETLITEQLIKNWAKDSWARCLFDPFLCEFAKPIQDLSCLHPPCPTWSEWQGENLCSASCGGGRRFVIRYCNNGVAGEDCIGESIMLEDCNEQPCPSWTSWRAQGKCSEKCGEGHRIFKRKCMLRGVEHPSKCYGSDLLVRQCVRKGCRPHWASWVNFGECYGNCGRMGTRSRYRLCLENDTVISESKCPGDSWDNIQCATDQNSCVSENNTVWGDWTQWTPCNCTNTNHKTRSRKCFYSRSELEKSEDKKEANFAECLGGKRASTQSMSCSLDCPSSWQEWGGWSSCSSTCGRGHQIRNRECPNYLNEKGNCPGNALDYKSCYSPPCWNKWVNITACNQSCGNGTYVMARRCLGRTKYKKEYMNCVGENKAYLSCNEQDCPKWSEWASWKTCSTTCGIGVQTRRRHCLQGECVGNDTETAACNLKPCPYWTEWSNFTCCSVTCGKGKRIRKRSCQHGNPGTDCPGASIERMTCVVDEYCNNTRVIMPPVCGEIDNKRGFGNRIATLKILGGRVADNDEYPWQASWQYHRCVSGNCIWDHVCGAVVISKIWVVTAGHCIREPEYQRINEDNPGKSWSVVVEMRRLNYDGKRFFVRRIFTHERYQIRDVPKNDIALLKLFREVPDTVMPLCLPSGHTPTHLERCYISGWGDTSPVSKLSVDLKGASVKYLNKTYCSAQGYEYRKYVGSGQFCAYDNNVDTCMGDSGGALACINRHGHWYMAGITSFGFNKCGTPGNIGIYTNVTVFEPWINNKISLYSHGQC